MKDSSSIGLALKKLIPHNKRVVICDSKNKDLVVMVVKLLSHLVILWNHMNKKYQEEMRSKVELRSTANGKDSHPDILVFLDQAQQIKNDLTKQIEVNRTQLTINNVAAHSPYSFTERKKMVRTKCSKKTRIPQEMHRLWARVYQFTH